MWAWQPVQGTRFARSIPRRLRRTAGALVPGMWTTAQLQSAVVGIHVNDTTSVGCFPPWQGTAGLESVIAPRGRECVQVAG